MGLQIINRKAKGFSILDENRLILEDVSREVIEEYFIAEFKKRFWDICSLINVSEEDYACLAGKIVCCDCGSQVTKYNKSWKEHNQRCERCKK